MSSKRKDIMTVKNNKPMLTHPDMNGYRGCKGKAPCILDPSTKWRSVLWLFLRKQIPITNWLAG